MTDIRATGRRSLSSHFSATSFAALTEDRIRTESRGKLLKSLCDRALSFDSQADAAMSNGQKKRV